MTEGPQEERNGETVPTILVEQFGSLSRRYRINSLQLTEAVQSTITFQDELQTFTILKFLCISQNESLCPSIDYPDVAEG